MYKRKKFNQILPYLKTDDVVVIHGARQTGKTTLLKLLMETLPSEDVFYFDLEDSRLLAVCEEGPESIVQYLRQKGVLANQDKFFLLIDEIQYLSDPSKLLKMVHDHYPQLKLIVSGSSSFDIKSKFKDSLVGRTADFELYPLDFEEYLRFKGKMFVLEDTALARPLLEELNGLYREFVLYGGYPKIVLTDQIDMKEKHLQQIIDTYVKSDIRDLAHVRHVDKFSKLLAVLAAQSGKLLNVTELSRTAQIAQQTIEEYLFILESTYVVKRIPPFSGNIRSELFKTPKVFFYDTGIMHMLCGGALPQHITGNALETSVFCELVKNAGAKNIFHWRTQDKKEIDFILSKGDVIRSIEVKLNAAAFTYTATRYFKNNYAAASNFCVSMEGDLPQNPLPVSNVRPWDRSYKQL